MKVRVKLSFEYDGCNHGATALVARYKTNKDVFYKRADIIRYYYFSILPQVPFIEQLEELLSGGHMKETVEKIVTNDILTQISDKQREKLFKDKENELISMVDGLKFDFEIDDDKLNN